MPTYLVTGASRGLGYAFITALAADASNTVIGLVRNKQATEQKLKEDGIDKVHLVSADMVDPESLKQAAEQVSKIVGGRGLDVLICNAAYVSNTTALTTLRDYESIPQTVISDTQTSMTTNLIGTLQTVYAFLPLIRRSHLKKAIAISSGMGDLDLINHAHLANAAPYALSKAALSALFAKLGAAYEDEGILFASLCPGFIATDATEAMCECNDCLPFGFYGLQLIYATVTAAAGSDEDAARLQDVMARFLKYTASFSAATPEEAAKRCLVAIERTSLKDGYGGSFLSHNGTKQWL